MNVLSTGSPRNPITLQAGGITAVIDKFGSRYATSGTTRFICRVVGRDGSPSRPLFHTDAARWATAPIE
jgi:hypothetical protein